MSANTSAIEDWIDEEEIEEELEIMKNETEADYVGGLNQYFRDIDGIPVLSAEEEHELSIKAKNGDKAAWNSMVLHNLRLALYVAKRYSFSNDYEDLIQEANLGVIKALEKYDPYSGYKFSTYAFNWVQQHIRRYLDSNVRLIRVPIHVIEKVRVLNKNIEKYTSEHGEKPSSTIIQKWLKDIGLSEEGYKQYNASEGLSSLNTPIVASDGDSDVELGDYVPAKEDVVKESEQIFIHELVENALNQGLTKQEADILRYRYYDQLTLETVGNIYGVTRERIRQIESKAKRKLKFARRFSYLRELHRESIQSH